jgi:hypothetical protein
MKKKKRKKKYNNFETILKPNIKIVDTRKRYKMDTLITQIQSGHHHIISVREKKLVFAML